jgi:hypothetical protein
MIFVETIPVMGGEQIMENGREDELNYDIL